KEVVGSVSVISCGVSRLRTLACRMVRGLAGPTHASGKKKPANDFSLRHMCYWHVLGAIGRPLAGHWQVGQQIGCQLLNTLPISWQWYKWHNWVDALLPKATICDIFMGCNICMHSYLINCNT